MQITYQKINNIPYIVLKDDEDIIKMDFIFDYEHYNLLHQYYSDIAEASEHGNIHLTESEMNELEEKIAKNPLKWDIK